MKKLIILILLVLSFGYSNAQFILTENGFVDSKNIDKAFLVFELDSISQRQISDLTNQKISLLFKSPKDVISRADSSLLSINAFTKKAIKRNEFHVFDIEYSIVFRFKDGKIRVDAPTFELTTFTNKKQTLALKANSALDGRVIGIFNEQGVLKQEMAKSQLEIYFNEFVNSLIKSLLTGNSEDW